MKNKNYLFNNFKYIASTQKFQLVILLLIINALYGGFIVSRPGLYRGYANNIYNIYTSPYFLMILLAIMLFHMFYVYDIFSKNNEYIIRLKTKKEYMNKLIKIIIYNNLVVYIIELIFILIIVNLFYSDSIGIEMTSLGVNNLVYITFFIMRTFIIISLLNIICLYLSEIFNKYIAMVINIIVLASIPIGLDLYTIRFSNFIIPTYIGTYFRLYPLYGNFLTELSSSIIFIFFMCIVIFILKKIKIRNMCGEII